MDRPLLTPPVLSPGSRVALVAPARFASKDLLDKGMSLLEDWGLTPVVHPSTSIRHHQWGGTDEQRAEALNAAFRDPSIRAVWALRGGYGCTRLLPALEASAFQSDPIWMLGFSDVTALHGWASNLGVASIHGPVTGTMDQTDARDVDALRTLLTTGMRSPEQGAMRVVGGNLSVLYAMLGTPYMPSLKGKWLLLEDLDEYLYHLDRMLTAMGQAGVWQDVEGVLVGSFTGMRDNTVAFGQKTDNPFGATPREILASHLKDCEVRWDVPTGHGKRNMPWVLG